MTLIELLVSMIVLGVVSTMIYTSWIDMNRSYAYTVNSNVTRDDARQATARMEREIRDAEPTAAANGSLIYASPYWICFTTTFNNPDAALATAAPHLTVYRLYTDNTLWKFEDADNNGTISGISMSDAYHSGGSPNVAEETTGEGAIKLTGNVANLFGTPTPLFSYCYFASTGASVVASGVPTSNLYYQDVQVTAVLIHLKVDLNPLHPPVYVDFQTTATFRN